MGFMEIYLILWKNGYASKMIFENECIEQCERTEISWISSEISAYVCD